MFRRLLPILAASFLLAGCTLRLPTAKKAGLQVTSFPTATVFLNSKSLGSTPLPRQENLKPGAATLKIVPQDATLSPYETQVNLIGGVVTVVDHKFNANPDLASSYSLSFEPLSTKKSSQIAITTLPSAVSVSVDNVPKACTPASIDPVTAGEHRILLSSPGYEDKLILAQTIDGYRLVIQAQLAKKPLLPIPTPTPEATPSATPAPSLTVAPTKKPTPTPVVITIPKPYAQIRDTPTGFLRVRSTPGGTEIGQVLPGQAFPYLSVNTDSTWVQITYQATSSAWVSAQYVTVVK